MESVSIVVLRFIRYLQCFSYSNLTSMVLQAYKRLNFLQLRKWLTVTKYARWTTLLLFSCWFKVDNEWPRSRWSQRAQHKCKGCAPCPQECAGASWTLATPPSGIALRQVSLANIFPLSLGPTAPPHSADAGHPLHLW